MINKKLLLEDVKFPLTVDDVGYIRDANREMIAMFGWDRNINKEMSEQILIAINSYIEDSDRPMKEFPKVTLRNGSFYDVNDKLFMITRGWGRLQYKSDPEIRQDNISNYLLMAMNSFLI